jgi:3-hydroxyacyl-[acyl-carrier protein] dehydratase/trans-2-decenoyl-[acyl-carrier protein] isomerase
MKASGRGRALGVGEVNLTSMIAPTVKKLTYHVHMKRVILRRLVMGISDGVVTADDTVAFQVTDMKVGLFKDGAPAAGAA